MIAISGQAWSTVLDVVPVDIGGGARIVPGMTIGDDAIVGAGSVVTRDVAVGETVMGNPARTARR